MLRVIYIPSYKQIIMLIIPLTIIFSMFKESLLYSCDLQCWNIPLPDKIENFPAIKSIAVIIIKLLLGNNSLTNTVKVYIWVDIVG